MGDYVEITGGLEVSAHGVVGMGWVSDKSVTSSPVLTVAADAQASVALGFDGHEALYVNVHITGTNYNKSGEYHDLVRHRPNMRAWDLGAEHRQRLSRMINKKSRQRGK